MIAICIGHSRGDGGAVSVDGTNEWHYNRRLGRLVLNDLRERGFAAMLVDKYQQGGYSASMAVLARNLKSQGVTLAVELHFNAADGKASGHEWIYWHTSAPGRALAQKLSARMCETFPEAKRRGIKAADRGGRGAGFLVEMDCPAVICEPFFGDHPDDWGMAMAHRDLLARVIADGIDDWMGGGDE